MRQLITQSEAACQLKCLVEPPDLHVDGGMARLVGIREVGHDAAQPNQLLGLRLGQRFEEIAGVPGRHSIAIQSGIHLDGRDRLAPGGSRRRKQLTELSERDTATSTSACSAAA